MGVKKINTLNATSCKTRETAWYENRSELDFIGTEGPKKWLRNQNSLVILPSVLYSQRMLSATLAASTSCCFEMSGQAAQSRFMLTSCNLNAPSAAIL